MIESPKQTRQIAARRGALTLSDGDLPVPEGRSETDGLTSVDHHCMTCRETSEV